LKPRVLIADDHEIVREGIKNLLQRGGYEIVGEAANGRAAVALSKKLRPDLVLLDVSMPLLNGIDAAREIGVICPRAKIILLTMHRDEHYVLEALRAGITGYVLKTQVSGDLVKAMESALRGEVYLCSGISGSVAKAALKAGSGEVNPLTQRERAVLQLIAEGKSNKEVAAHLGISIKTAEAHRRNIMLKLDIHETAGLVRHAIRISLIEP
jgi:DNA-binding NarL/FixJ family response regulator